MVGETIKKAMILVPHQDDEISVAGAVIEWLKEKKAEIFLCYVTNGDYELSADLRFSEAKAAMNVLGIPENHIIMLGYPDTSNEDGLEHIFYYTEEKAFVSKAGECHTYGTKSFQDYASHVTGKAHAYTRAFYQQDLQALIEDLLPDFLICVDMDKHVDHRMLSLEFERAIGKILKGNRNYQPVIWKAFSYGTGFGAPRDYWQVNLNRTVKPETRLKDNAGRLDNPFYDWDSRIRIPVKKGWYGFPISQGSLYRALSCYQSQKTILSAELIINSDQVFWERRTDNLLLHANICASSGNADCLNDFMLFDATQIHEEDYVQMTGLWCPTEEDTEKTLSIHFEKEETIGQISLWGIGTDVLIEVQVENQFFEFETKDWCGEWVLKFPQELKMQDISIKFRYSDVHSFGIGEMEAFLPENISPVYLKILADDLMTDTYYTCFHMPEINIYEYCRHNLHRDKHKYEIIVNGRRVDSFRELSKLKYRRKIMTVEVRTDIIPLLEDTMKICFLTPLAWWKKKKQLKEWKCEFEKEKNVARKGYLEMNKKRNEQRKAWLILTAIIAVAIGAVFLLTKDFREYLRDYADFKKYQQYVHAMEEENNAANESKPEETGSDSVPENQTPATTPATEEPDPVQPSGNVLAGSKLVSDVSGNTVWQADMVSEEAADLIRGYVAERNEVYTWENSYAKTLKINELDKKILASASCTFPNVHINFVGDSITEGVGGNEDANGNKISYVNYVQNALQFGQVTNNGIAGGTIAEYHSNEDLAIEQHHDKLYLADAQITVVYAGLNDYLFPEEEKNFGVIDDGSTGGYCGQLQVMFRSLKEKNPNMQCFFVTAFQTSLPNPALSVTNFDGIPALNDYMEPQRQLAAANGYPVIDLFNTGFMDMRDAETAANLLSDSTHPNDAGYQILGDHIATEILLYYLGIN